MMNVANVAENPCHITWDGEAHSSDECTFSPIDSKFGSEDPYTAISLQEEMTEQPRVVVKVCSEVQVYPSDQDDKESDVSTHPLRIFRPDSMVSINECDPDCDDNTFCTVRGKHALDGVGCEMSGTLAEANYCPSDGTYSGRPHQMSQVLTDVSELRKRRSCTHFICEEVTVSSVEVELYNFGFRGDYRCIVVYRVEKTVVVAGSDLDKVPASGSSYDTGCCHGKWYSGYALDGHIHTTESGHDEAVCARTSYLPND